MKTIRSLMAPLGTPEICPFRIMFIVSYPLIVRRAVLKEPISVVSQKQGSGKVGKLKTPTLLFHVYSVSI